MNNLNQILLDKLNSIKEEGRYRIFRNLSRECGEFPKAIYHKESGQQENVVVWCSNDYLGMGQHPLVLQAMHATLDSMGAGAGGTRNISGTHSTIVELEHELAALQQKEARLVFSSGYVANQTTLQTLGNLLPDAIFFSDEDNHASMIEGMRYCRAKRVVFKHNQVSHLRELLREAPKNASKIVAFESLYSMSGDFSPAADLIEVAKEFDALIFVDETHAVGVHGPHGAGRLEQLGLLQEVDIVQGGLGKGFGVIGGFVSANAIMIDAIRSFGAGFIFTTTIPPVVAAGALSSVKFLKSHPERRAALMERVSKTRTKLTAHGLPLLESSSQIIPVIIGDAFLCKQIADILLEEHNCYVQPINYPTVPRGTERLRVTPSPFHTDQMIDQFADSLSLVWNKCKASMAA